MLLTIRKVNVSDLETLRILAERTFRDAWQDYDYNDPEDFETYCRENFSPEGIKAGYDRPDAEFYVVFIGEEPAGYLKLNLHKTPPHDWDGSPAMQLERIYVSAQFQGQRIGEQLLRFSEERAREAGDHWIWLSVWQKSPRSVAFYERNGFSIFGVEIFWLGADPQSDWLMRKAM